MFDRPFSPACERNREPIQRVLAQWLPAASGRVLEVASGTGQHASYFAAAFPEITWQPSDRTDQHFAGIAAWTGDLPNVAAPIVLDVTRDWPDAEFDFVFNANMIHISPWATTEGLFRGAARVVSPEGAVGLYGPFLRADVETSESNRAFDASLRARDVSWGIRSIEAVDAVAAEHGFRRTDLVEMPAHNCFVRFVRR